MKTLLLIFSIVSLALADNSITFTENGYDNVIVSISPDVPSEQGSAIIDGIKNWIIRGSEKLYYSTRKLAFIRSVKIFIPQSWSGIEDVESSTDIVYEDGIIRVEGTNPLFGDVPYTIQPGGCGERGDRTQVTPDYLLNLNGTSTDYYGPPENIFVHEWAKLRYGVFEEYGYPGDRVYPMFYYTAKSELAPNFCTDSDLQGHGEDIVNGGTCTIDPNTGIPDENCIFIPDGTNENVESSMMATPFLASTSEFCRHGEDYYHNRNLPTKQNALCSGLSTWEVISNNEELINAEPSSMEKAPDPQFTLLQPQEGQFVMVLDISLSMDDYSRLDRLKEATMRWTRYDIRDGSYLGVTSFSKDTYEDEPMTLINDASRDDIIESINELETKDVTCLGAGVRQGLETLSQTSESGGIMIFVTDGEFKCKNGDDKTNLDDPVLIQEIIDSKVRIVTIAFGQEADDDLENLATVSNGKTYFVPDGSGIEDLNNALQGSLTYQPSIPSGEMDFVIFKGHYEDFENSDGSVEEEFIIDNTLGRDVAFQMDYNMTDPNSIEEIQFSWPNGSQVVYPFSENSRDPVHTFVINLGNLTAGTYAFSIITNDKVTYADILIKSKTKETTTLPYTTNCWTSSGSEDVDPNERPVAILAEVKQGNMPVINAQVEAEIEKEGQPTAIILELLDNGSGADQVANDGLYSRYFTSYFDETGRYLIKCQVKSTDSTEVNGGFIASRKKRYGRGYPIKSTLPPPCCGSNTLRENSLRIPTGYFTRQTSGGSFKVVNTIGNNADIFAPSKVMDFSVVNDFDSENALKISFTSPGDDFDNGTVAFYDFRFVEDDSDALFDNYNATNRVMEEWLMGESSFDPVEGGTRKVLLVRLSPELTGKVLYFAMKAEDEAGNTGDLSNVVRVAFGVGKSDNSVATILPGLLFMPAIIFNAFFVTFLR